jgi:hypothetical protein
MNMDKMNTIDVKKATNIGGNSALTLDEFQSGLHQSKMNFLSAVNSACWVNSDFRQGAIQTHINEIDALTECLGTK